MIHKDFPHLVIETYEGDWTKTTVWYHPGLNGGDPVRLDCASVEPIITVSAPLRARVVFHTVKFIVKETAA